MKTKVTIATRRTIPTAFPRGEIPRGGGKEKREREIGERGERGGGREGEGEGEREEVRGCWFAEETNVVEKGGV